MASSDAGILLSLPFACIWLLIARIVSFIAPFFIVPSLMTASTFYKCIPFAKSIFSTEKQPRGFFMRIGFEATYCMNVIRRYLTLPMRKRLPDVYILGFPKCGTTALATYLLRHQGVVGLDGLPWDATLSKESHFFMGILGRDTTGSKRWYASFFPTYIELWWKEKVLKRAERMLCLDACPLNACLPYTAERIKQWTPDAKLIFMVRDPVDAMFSGEIMLRNAGVDLPWTLAEETETAKHPSLSVDAAAYFRKLEHLSMDEPLPEDLPHHVYYSAEAALYFSTFADRVQPFLDRFPPKNIRFISLSEMSKDRVEDTVKSTLEFIGADTDSYTFTPWKMWSGERKGRTVDPAFREQLNAYFEDSTARLEAMMQEVNANNNTQPRSATAI
ncbi:hypothetical protein PSENEW3_00005532 [Picochlorum sp. SENEW3]|nr:hypothetical protein PSENEW3_00005532 [Picochlorum sp. SENEW3]